MNVSVDLITGVSIGFEFVEAIPDMDVPRTIIIDIIVFRFLIEY